MTNPLNIKQAVQDWMNSKYESWIKQPIEKRTQELESFVTQQVKTYGTKAQTTAYQPIDYYQNQPTIYRGLFWIVILLLIVLWIISSN